MGEKRKKSFCVVFCLLAQFGTAYTQDNGSPSLFFSAFLGIDTGANGEAESVVLFSPCWLFMYHRILDVGFITKIVCT